jgi:hypothetical protein
MCEPLTAEDLKERIDDLLASGKQNGAVLAALQSHGYEIVLEPLFGIGIKFTDQGSVVTYYHPKLVPTSNKPPAP